MVETVAAIAIGRNEGERLRACLASLQGGVDHIIYVDSGSTDNSRSIAHQFSVPVVDLDMTRPFTAARARNAGYQRVLEIDPEIRFVQFLDGDCEIDPDWIASGRRVLSTMPDVAVVCGRRREKYPEASLWNWLVEREWGTPTPGDVKACGGDALMRVTAFEALGGFNPSLIAGEEPELCYRLRQAGWRVVRLEAEMTRHDAALSHFSQFWQRARRTGHTYAEGAAMYGRGPEQYRIRETRRALVWGLGVPLVAGLGVLLISPLFLLVLLAWPMQVLRLRAAGQPWAVAFFVTISKIAEVQGIIGYWRRRLRGQRHTLIEYK